MIFFLFSTVFNFLLAARAAVAGAGASLGCGFLLVGFLGRFFVSHRIDL